MHTLSFSLSKYTPFVFICFLLIFFFAGLYWAEAMWSMFTPFLLGTTHKSNVIYYTMGPKKGARKHNAARELARKTFKPYAHSAWPGMQATKIRRLHKYRSVCVWSGLMVWPSSSININHRHGHHLSYQNSEEVTVRHNKLRWFSFSFDMIINYRHYRKLLFLSRWWNGTGTGTFWRLEGGSVDGPGRRGQGA